MGDPIGLTASFIAIAGLAWTSCQSLYDVINGLIDAPQAIVSINNEITAVQAVINTLREVLKNNQSAALEPVLQRIGIDVALKGCTKVCTDFTETIAQFTTRSTKEKFSKRDRLRVTFRKSKICSFRERLRICKNTINLALTSATLYVEFI